MSRAADVQDTGFARETAVLAAGLVTSQAVLLAVMPLWSRLYGPEQFAALGVWTAVGSTVATLVLLRYDSAIVVATDDAQARALRRLGWRSRPVGEGCSSWQRCGCPRLPAMPSASRRWMAGSSARSCPGCVRP